MGLSTGYFSNSLSISNKKVKILSYILEIILILIDYFFSEKTIDLLLTWNMTTKMSDNIITSLNTIKDLKNLRTTSPSFTVEFSSKHITKKFLTQSTSYLHEISTTDQTGDKRAI